MANASLGHDGFQLLLAELQFHVVQDVLEFLQIQQACFVFQIRVQKFLSDQNVPIRRSPQPVSCWGGHEIIARVTEVPCERNLLVIALRVATRAHARRSTRRLERARERADVRVTRRVLHTRHVV